MHKQTVESLQARASWGSCRHPGQIEMTCQCGRRRCCAKVQTSRGGSRLKVTLVRTIAWSTCRCAVCCQQAYGVKRASQQCTSLRTEVLEKGAASRTQRGNYSLECGSRAPISCQQSRRVSLMATHYGHRLPHSALFAVRSLYLSRVC